MKPNLYYHSIFACLFKVQNILKSSKHNTSHNQSSISQLNYNIFGSCIHVRDYTYIKKENILLNSNKGIVCTPASFLLGGRDWGLNLQPNFQKGKDLTGCQFLKGGCWESGFFQRERAAVFT